MNNSIATSSNQNETLMDVERGIETAWSEEDINNVIESNAELLVEWEQLLAATEKLDSISEAERSKHEELQDILASNLNKLKQLNLKKTKKNK